MTTYTATKEAGATALNPTGIIVSATASFTATSGEIQEDADYKALKGAKSVAQSQAENASNIMTQGTEVTIKTFEERGFSGFVGPTGSFNENDLTIFSDIGISLPQFGKNWNNKVIYDLQFLPIYGLAMVSSGEMQIGVTFYAGIFMSSDYGSTWVKNSDPGISNPKIAWGSVATNSTGQYITAVSNNGYGIWTSNDSGNTWTQNTEPEFSVVHWSSVAMSLDGRLQTAVSGNGYGVWTSIDYGTTWVQNMQPELFDSSFSSVASTSSGTVQTIVGQNGLWLSKDSGNTWTQNTEPELSGITWSSVAMSSDGRLQTAVSDNGLWQSSDSGNTWTKNAQTDLSDERWSYVTMNFSGERQTVGSLSNSFTGYIWTSNDYGNTWIQKTKNLGFICGAMSSDGMYQTTQSNNDGILKSTDFGSTWKQVFDQAILEENSSRLSVAMSSSGQYQTILEAPEQPDSTIIWVSSDFGNTWKKNTDVEKILDFIPNDFSWTQVAISSTGQYQTADESFYYGIWISNDFGNTWKQSTTETINISWTSVAMSASGQYQTSLSSDSGIWISIDFGKSWIQNTNAGIINVNWTSVAMTASGKYQSALSRGYGIWTSTDFGKTWKQNTNPETINIEWSSVAMSASGQYQTSVVGNSLTPDSSIWTSDDFGNTWKQNATPGTTESFISVAMSSSGQYQSTMGEIIWTSIDFGNTWIQNSSTTDVFWTGIAMSSSGQYNTAVSFSTGIWRSNNPLTPVGENYGDYLYWDSNVEEWAVGSSNIRIGSNAGQTGQGEYSIAIGFAAGQTGQPSNSIVLNATGSGINGNTGGAFYVAPIRSTKESIGAMIYNKESSEITYNPSKTFVIDHPTDKERYLVHACLEGPEAGVYYRGKGEITNDNITVIHLPFYAQKIASNFTIHVTPIFTVINSIAPTYQVSEVKNGSFVVNGPPGKFYWIVYGERISIEIDPLKSDVQLKGDGPYTWI